MSVMRSKDGNNLVVDCKCGCDNGIRIRVDKEDEDMYFFLSYTSGNFYSEQGDKLWGVIYRKLKKIWSIIRNKDYHYSDICMTKDEFKEFQTYIASIE